MNEKGVTSTCSTSNRWGNVDAKGMIVVLGVGLVGFLICAIVERWWVKKFVKSFMTRTKRNGGNQEESPRLMPESLYVVRLSASAVSCTRPNGMIEGVEWNDLQRVEVLTTDEGPFIPDAFWVLQGSKHGCVIPWGATGEKQLLKRLQGLPGFRNEAIIEAGTDNRRILCWERSDA